AYDRDDGSNAIIKYNIVGGNEEKLFDIDEDTGVVFSVEKLNFERQTEYALHIAARNVLPFQGPKASKLANPFVRLIIKVQDVNDELVVFLKPSYEYKIKENTTRSVTVGYVNASNPHREPLDQDITYWIGEGNSEGKFWINPSSGELILMDRVDRDPPENQEFFKLRIFARDLLSRNQFNTTVPVTIFVEDINDNAPTFDEEKYVLELPENLPIGTQLPGFYKVKDIDSGNNGKIENYTLVGSEVLAVEKKPNVNPEAKKSTTTVEIHLLDANDNNPQFVPESIYNFHATELELPGTIIGN
ncbi:protocadherin Fat 4-like, partial [Centruroides sculpturatus]|uniref:protocadherin Fat 4-like n=1 Tax=Centruroides sculpturatus TaxID=218467 RepID=UPI000C6CF361